MAMSLTRRATVCAVAVAALVSSVAHAQCDPSSRITLATTNTDGVTGFTGAKSVAGATTPAIEKVCAVFVCPAGTDRAELEGVKLARSEAVPVSALNGVQTRVGNGGVWRAMNVPVQEDAANNALASSAPVPLSGSTSEEVQVEVSVQTSAVATVVSLTVNCYPQDSGDEFPMVPYLIAAVVIPLAWLCTLCSGIALREYHPGVRAKMAEWGWVPDTGVEAPAKTIENRAGGAMWYDNATEVVKDLNKDTIYETDERADDGDGAGGAIDEDQAAIQALL